ncbi:MAG: hypothetical protein M1829_000162 [Trizodia sp. TS-e1964]|nr:MAG: hypothetical protein M1829_000162 [Trizodia sp. TS-e1964]
MPMNEWEMHPPPPSTTLAPDQPTEEIRFISFFRSPGFRRQTMLCLGLITACLITWSLWAEDRWHEQIIMNQSFEATHNSKENIFALNHKPKFSDMIQVMTMDSSLLPNSQRQKHGNRKRRLLLVGDVHGCRNELIALLDKISFSPQYDHLVLTGDMISKGPDSPGVVDFARSVNASCVRGNHEDRVLLARQNLHSNRLSTPSLDEIPSSSNDDDLEGETFSRRGRRDRKLAKQLTQEQIDWLKACPVILRVGDIEGMGHVVVVHAGLVPGVDFENQDPFDVMNMRTIELKTHAPSPSRQGTHWADYWNHYQSRLPREERSVVVYGHDSRRGLTLKKYSKGIDTGCVRRGKLSALVIKGPGRATQRVHSVKCHHPRHKPRSR